MRAVVYDAYGPPDVLRFADVPKPSPERGEILVRVIAATVNRTDTGFRKGEPRIVRLFSGLRHPRRRILGNELAGEVAEVGAGVTRFKVGDRVCGLIGDHFGAHAEYVSVSEDAALVPMPSGFRPEVACALWDGPWLALTCLRKADVHRGQDVLVYGASGSIGSSAVQIAKHLGARVTAVCRAEAVEKVRSLGPDDVVDTTRTDFTQIGRAFDLVLDAVGKSTFGACKRLVKPGGRYISTDFGPWFQNPLLQVWTRFVGNKRAGLAIPNTGRMREDVLYLRDLVEVGALHPLIDRTYRFEEMVDAHRYVDTEQKIGSVVILIGEGV
jgi:NADPH:quinone reductase-like Zn-dependent oxidoreductase